MTARNWNRQAQYDKIRRRGFTTANEDGNKTAEIFARALRRRRAAATDPIHDQMLEDAKQHREKRAKIKALALALTNVRKAKNRG